MKYFFTPLLLIGTISFGFANLPSTVPVQLNWNAGPILETDEWGSHTTEIWRFEGAVYDEAHPSLPYFYYRLPLDGYSKLAVTITQAEYEPFSKNASPDDAVLAENIQVSYSVTHDRGQYFGKVQFIPIRKTGPQSFERLVRFTLEIAATPAPAPRPALRGGDPTYTSKLSDGVLYKIGIPKAGVYKIDYDFLVNQLGISPGSFDPRNLQLLGNGGGMLSEQVSDPRIDDLVENTILVAGQDDGSFDPQDYILFYAEGPHDWSYEENTFKFQMNVYDTRNYYFLKIASSPGQRIAPIASVQGGYTTATFDDYLRKEDEKVNLLDKYDLTQGSGRQWYGDYFKNQEAYTYDLNLENLDNTEKVQMRVQFAGRADSPTTFQVIAGGQSITSPNIPGTVLTNPNATYASAVELDTSLTVTPGILPVTVKYMKKNGITSEGWLDYIQLNFRRKLIYNGAQLLFRDTRTLDHPNATFQIGNAGSALRVWDITDPLHPGSIEGTLNGSTYSFGANTGELREFVAYQNDASLLVPEAVGAIPNQNLHGIDNVDMVILYHSSLFEEAKRLADHRSSHDGLEIALVDIAQLYNEFSSGKQDATAVRDFCKMLYDRNDRFRFLLLFGDASFDHRNIGGEGNQYVVCYQTEESDNPIFAYPSDDFFGLLSEGEGAINTNDDLDIAIGRLPVRNLEEAKGVVDKIINYDSNPDCLGDWRNRVVFVADDEDNDIHRGDADGIAVDVSENFPILNIDKIYLDAFNQISTPGGKRVPSATESLNNHLFRGVLSITYLGHGGAKGWAQERVLQIPDIVNWDNFDKLPLFITATCSFSGYDDPSFTSAGELVLLNRNGGGIGLYTTVRAVYASTNETLTRAVNEEMYIPEDGKGQCLGEIFRKAKNKAGGKENSRKFTLLGDPSLRLALPQYDIATTAINGTDVNSGQPDTIRALQKVTIAGEVRDANGATLESFNGLIYPSIFDKAVEYKTLGQDGSPIRTYKLQKNVLFKGRVSVTQGKFQFTFVVPKDINFNFGKGKISYYAENGLLLDASGQYQDLVIGGTDPNAAADDQGPQVDVFMNSDDFVFGGITSASPILLVQLEDDLGINVVGNSIGHDLTGVLDENTQKTFLLNDFYEAKLDDYTQGEVRFPLSELAEGRHSMRVRAWDVANNSAEGYTEFVVASSAEVALKHVLNYPNPFVNATCFQFEHNLENQEIDVQVDIYTISGRLVKSLEERIFSEGSRLSLGNCIQWDGRDNFGDPLAKGVYLYKIKVQAVNTGEVDLRGESGFQKLVILR
ncbi:MAG: type IX secretion system sortase PorU [Lewinellaceae bacterium]|nr:type IX secretion system sortase PorU [Lewinellaceae bacterium]